MDWFVRWFIRAALAWLGTGVVLGTAMAFAPAAAAYRPAHVHANLLGFVAMMIFGVAYHVLPRFNGRPLFRRSWAIVHLAAANAGLALLVGGWVVRVHAPGVGAPLIAGGAVLSAAGAFLFIVNIWVTLEPQRHAGARPVHT